MNPSSTSFPVASDSGGSASRSLFTSGTSAKHMGPSENANREADRRAFFDREAPPGYLEEWAARLAVPEDRVEPDLRSLFIFRLGREWLAIDTSRLVEVTEPQPVHSIPHRSNRALLGLVNVRGQLRLCVSLHELLGVESAESSTDTTHPSLRSVRKSARMVIVRDEAEQWAFLADEVARVQRLPHSQLRKVPSTFHAEASVSQAVFEWSGRTVGYLDDHRLIVTLRSLFG